MLKNSRIAARKQLAEGETFSVDEVNSKWRFLTVEEGEESKRT
jgi:hypothetical protein